MRINSRQARLIDLLKYQQGIKTISEYADIFAVSNRTISNDLNVVESILCHQGYYIDRKQGIGINVVKNKTITSNQILPSIDNSSTEYRKFIIAKMLFIDEKILTYEELAQKFRVSISSLQRDIKFIKSTFLNKNGAKIISDYKGTRMEGNEIEIRNTLIAFNELIIQKLCTCFINERLQKDMSYYYGNKLVESCKNIINSLIKSGVKIEDPNYLKNIFNVLIVTSYRANIKRHIEDNVLIIDHKDPHHIQYFILSKDLLLRLSKETSIVFEESDCSYLASHLIANKVVLLQVTSTYEKEINEMTKKILNSINSMLGIDLSDDNNLKNQLIEHLRPMIYRLKNNIHIKNVLLKDIKKEFRLLFDVLWIALQDEFYKNKIDITEDEVSFLVIYVQIALEMKKRIKRVLVVSPTGIATSNLIVNRIKCILPPLDIVETRSISEISMQQLQSIDFIISTVDIEEINKPIVLVSSLINDRDKENILKFYKKKYINNKDKKYKTTDNDILLKIIDKNLIEINNNFTKREEVIRH
ncbi:MAG: PRD domain-containing protein, partial [Tissierellia bacterium]|nr:PRD domain-containing protein [Tissierellia bacterium]